MHSNIQNVGNIQNIQNFNINVQNGPNGGETEKSKSEISESASLEKSKAQEKRYELLESRFLDMEQQHMALAAQLIRKDEYF